MMLCRFVKNNNLKWSDSIHVQIARYLDLKRDQFLCLDYSVSWKSSCFEL